MLTILEIKFWKNWTVFNPSWYDKWPAILHSLRRDSPLKRQTYQQIIIKNESQHYLCLLKNVKADLTHKPQQLFAKPLCLLPILSHPTATLQPSYTVPNSWNFPQIPHEAPCPPSLSFPAVPSLTWICLAYCIQPLLSPLQAESPPTLLLIQLSQYHSRVSITVSQ